MKKIILLAAVVMVCGGAFWYSNQEEKGLKITQWNNIYNENNISFFYEDVEKPSKNIKKLDSTFKINELIDGTKEELEKVMLTLEILHTIVECDDVENSKGRDGYSIIAERGGSKKVSQRDLAIIERDFLIALGFHARVGEFREPKPQYQKKPSYYVVEYFSRKHNKWVMIDVVDKGYLEKNGVILSAIEVVGEKLSDLTYIGKSSQNQYRRGLKSYTSSYTIPIDNTILGNKSNTNVTYLSGEENIDIKVGNEIIPSTIFTEEKEMFNYTPTFKSQGKDSETYLVMMRKPLDTSQQLTMVIGAFNSGTTIENYYLSINGEGFEKVEKYQEVVLQEGINKIELSLDGEKPLKTIEVKHIK